VDVYKAHRERMPRLTSASTCCRSATDLKYHHVSLHTEVSLSSVVTSKVSVRSNNYNNQSTNHVYFMQSKYKEKQMKVQYT